MARASASEIFASLAHDPRFRSWRDLPLGFREQTRQLAPAAALDLAQRLWRLQEHRYLYAATLLIEGHPEARRSVRWRFLETLGDRMGDWGAVDQFAVLAGPAWREGRISDARVRRWARSPNRWYRRAALVCTVYLNRHARGGTGDTARTLAICESLAGDRDDMVAKGLSWALRDLIAHDRTAVERFLQRHEPVLAARVKREVRCKLATGRKNASRSRGTRR